MIAASEDALPNGIRDAVIIALFGAMTLRGIDFRITEPSIEVALYWVFEMVRVLDAVSSCTSTIRRGKLNTRLFWILRIGVPKGSKIATSQHPSEARAS